MDIQILQNHDVKRPLDPGKSTQVKLQITHLHGTEIISLRLHAQYFALFLFPQSFSGFVKRFYICINVFVNKNIYII